MKKIAVLISGSGSNLEAIVKSCNSNLINGEVVSVISNNPDAYGLIRANNFKVNTKIINHNEFASRNEFEKVLGEYLDQLNVDLIVLAGFMRILGKKIINKFGHDNVLIISADVENQINNFIERFLAGDVSLPSDSKYLSKYQEYLTPLSRYYEKNI